MFRLPKSILKFLNRNDVFKKRNCFNRQTYYGRISLVILIKIKNQTDDYLQS